MGLKSVHLQLQSILENLLLAFGGGSDLLTDVRDVGQDLFALVAEVLFNNVHVFLGDGLLSNFVGRKVGSDGSGWDLFVGIGVSLSGTLFGGSNVDFVELESKDLSLDNGKEPGGSADTGGLKEESSLKEDVDNRVAEEGNGELSGDQLPGDGTKDGGNKSSHETQVEHSLDGVRDTEDVVLNTDFDVDGGNTSDDEEAKGDSHLTTAHESRKILSTVAEQAVACLKSDGRGSTFRLGELGDGEEGDLHPLKKTDAAHKNEEEDKRDSLRKSFPGRGLSTVEGFDGDS